MMNPEKPMPILGAIMEVFKTKAFLKSGCEEELIALMNNMNQLVTERDQEWLEKVQLLESKIKTQEKESNALNVVLKNKDKEIEKWNQECEVFRKNQKQLELQYQTRISKLQVEVSNLKKIYEKSGRKKGFSNNTEDQKKLKLQLQEFQKSNTIYQKEIQEQQIIITKLMKECEILQKWNGELEKKVFTLTSQLKLVSSSNSVTPSGKEEALQESLCAEPEQKVSPWQQEQATNNENENHLLSTNSSRDPPPMASQHSTSGFSSYKNLLPDEVNFIFQEMLNSNEIKNMHKENNISSLLLKNEAFEKKIDSHVEEFMQEMDQLLKQLV